MLAAADAFAHAAEHLEHLEQRRRGEPPRPSPPPEIARHLQHVYFRIQEADYFVKQDRDAEAKRLPVLAREFYQEALRAYDRGDWLASDTYSKSAEDVVRGLENLAQAAAPVPPPPPRAPGPR